MNIDFSIRHYVVTLEAIKSESVIQQWLRLCTAYGTGQKDA